MESQYIWKFEDISDDLLYVSLKILSKINKIEGDIEIIDFEEEILILKKTLKLLDELSVE